MKSRETGVRQELAFTGGSSPLTSAVGPRTDLDPYLTGLEREYFSHLAHEIPTYDEFKRSLNREPEDAQLIDFVERTFEQSSQQENLFKRAQAKGLAGLALWVHELTEMKLNVSKYGLSFEEMCDEEMRMGVYPFAHTDATFMQYHFLEQEARKRGHQVGIESLMLVDPLKCILENNYIWPQEDMAIDVPHRLLFSWLGERISLDPPGLDEIESAIEFYRDTSLPKEAHAPWVNSAENRATLVQRYEMSALYCYGLALANVYPLIRAIGDRLGTADIQDPITLGYEVGARLGDEFLFRSDTADTLEPDVIKALKPSAAGIFMHTFRTYEPVDQAHPLRFMEVRSLIENGERNRVSSHLQNQAEALRLS